MTDPSSTPAPATPPNAGPATTTTSASPEVSHGPGVVKRTATTVKRVLLVAVGALVALFAVFNSQNVEVRWIFGEPIQTPLILAIAVTFAAGATIGWLVAKLSGRSHS